MAKHLIITSIIATSSLVSPCTLPMMNSLRATVEPEQRRVTACGNMLEDNLNYSGSLKKKTKKTELITDKNHRDSKGFTVFDFLFDPNGSAYLSASFKGLCDPGLCGAPPLQGRLNPLPPWARLQGVKRGGWVGGGVQKGPRGPLSLWPFIH